MPRSTGRRVNKKQKKKKYKKATIPKAIREQCWIQVFGEKFKEKCYINWCENGINVFDFHVGHDKPESEGGTPIYAAVAAFVFLPPLRLLVRLLLRLLL